MELINMDKKEKYGWEGIDETHTEFKSMEKAYDYLLKKKTQMYFIERKYDSEYTGAVLVNKALYIGASIRFLMEQEYIKTGDYIAYYEDNIVVEMTVGDIILPPHNLLGLKQVKVVDPNNKKDIKNLMKRIDRIKD